MKMEKEDKIQVVQGLTKHLRSELVYQFIQKVMKSH